MGNIKKIFFRDIKALIKNPFAFLIAGGLCIIPALYAWFNIYSNWDPYGNTGNLQIAVATEDKGYVTEKGKKENVSDTVIETLKENESIGWVETPDAQSAIEGVESGKYYAAVIFAEDFTECMYRGFLNGMKRPEVTYYENEKKNAVATKITDTAVGTLENNINEQYISLVVSTLFDKQQEAVNRAGSEEVIENISARIQKVRDNIDDFAVTVKTLAKANDKLVSSLQGAGNDINSIGRTLKNAQTNISDIPDTDVMAENLSKKNSQLTTSLGNSLSDLRNAQQADKKSQKKKYYKQLSKDLQTSKNNVDDLINSLQVLNISTVNLSNGILLSQLENYSARLGDIIDRLDSNMDTEQSESALSLAEKELELQLENLQRSAQNTTAQSLAKLGSEIQAVADKASQMIESICGDIKIIDKIIDSGITTVDLTNKSFDAMAKQLDDVVVKLDEITESVDGISDAALTQKFLEFIQGNPDEYGAFFAEPVKVETEGVYPVENYGSGVAPFYTTLALWVGGVVLVSLIKVKAHTDGIKKAKPYQLFFGRYLLFLVLSLVQALIIVWGDIYLLHIQCLYPAKFLLVSLIASITFSLLIYSFTLSFGDVGKAAIVVIMVLQIAGSSGTYPIEILPEFYQNIYIFFPFPYAINAMREAICGMYESDFTLCVIRLMLFAAAALVLGLIIRIPFSDINHFVEKRMEDTEMM
ncbi:MAG: YhgE/Pip domain-containing protein [Lachnospiraceae bacterium]|nr:YhgE/Pip domain-containing protein [Lachnospiraceae bacterium]